MSDHDGPHLSPSSTSRRRFLAGTAALGASMLGSAPVFAGTTHAESTAQAPFTLGVASGDPWPDGVVLWTRLASDPLAPDGRGGMPDRPISVEYQVAQDENFRRIAAAGQTLAQPDVGHSVHIELSGSSRAGSISTGSAPSRPSAPSAAPRPLPSQARRLTGSRSPS